MRILLSFFLSVCFVSGYTQSSQAEYLEAKRQFALENYTVAKLGFQNLSQDKTFGAYASFYFALSAYKNGEPKLAYDMWRQLEVNDSDWDQQHEVGYWLTVAAFDLKRYSTAFRYLEDLELGLKELAMQQTFGQLEYDELKSAYLLNEESRQLASMLGNEIMKVPYSERDKELLKQITSKFDLDLKGEESNLPEIRKDRYAVAVVLPFMFDSVENPQTVLRNSIIWDLYQGMEMAKDDLRKENISLELFPFDTRKGKNVTNQIVRSGQLEHADVIVGPLYSGPNEVIASYSADQQVTMINPLSSNGEIVGDNPFSYLFNPTYETQGKAAAKYASTNFTNNKKAFVFFETDRDSLVARTYLNEIQKDSFFVVRFERMTNESAQQVQKDFTEKYEIRLDTMFTTEEMDSIGQLPGRIVKDRPLRNEKSGMLVRDYNGDPITEYYEERFTVVEDSIGHIFVASSSNLLANNFISLAEVRNDTIGIIGYDDWLEFSTISYNQLERLGIAFISPTLFKENTLFFETLGNAFIEKIGREPGQYHLLGYELIFQLGQLLNSHGKYFQRGLQNEDILEGKVMYGLSYGQYHDNQLVPITKLQDLTLVIQELSEKVASED